MNCQAATAADATTDSVQAPETHRRELKVGDKAPDLYKRDAQALQDWHARGLAKPEKESHWVRMGEHSVLVQITNGVILAIEPPPEQGRTPLIAWAVKPAPPQNPSSGAWSDAVSGTSLPCEDITMIKRMLCLSLVAAVLSLSGCVYYPYHHHDQGWRGWGHPYYHHGYYRHGGYRR